MNSNVKIMDVTSCQKELRVEIPSEDVQAEFDAVYQDLKRVARVPGFRVGYAPRDLLEQYHGTKAREEVLRRLIDRSLEEALKGQKPLDLVRRPEVTEIKFEPKQPLTYLAKLEVAPEVPLGRYKGFKLTRTKTETSEEALSQVLKRLQDSQAELKPVVEPRTAAAGDFLLADLTEMSKEKNKPPVKRRDLVIHLDVEKDPEGILKQLLGMTPGSQRTVQVKDGATITVDLKGLKVKEFPPVDDSLAKSIGPYESLEALKKAIREGLEREAEESVQRALEAQAIHQLIEEWNFDVPASLVTSQARRLLKERAVDLMNQGVPQPEVEERAQVLSEQAKMEALKQVKLFFILRRIATQEKISATQEEMEGRVQALAGRLRLSVEEVRKDLEARDLLEEVAWGIIRGKVLNLIVKEAEIKEG